MARFLLFFLLFGLHLYTLLDIAKAPWGTVRLIPKVLWAPVSLFPLLGPLAWMFFGRPLVGPDSGDSNGGGSGGTRGGPRPGRGPIAPDDDPEFLRRLDEQTWAARMEQLRRERGTGRMDGVEGPEGDANPGPERPPADRA